MAVLGKAAWRSASARFRDGEQMNPMRAAEFTAYAVKKIETRDLEL
jgi:hypothetical protein